MEAQEIAALVKAAGLVAARVQAAVLVVRLMHLTAWALREVVLLALGEALPVGAVQAVQVLLERSTPVAQVERALRAQ